MAFPTGWGRKCAVVISSTYVSGTSHTDFPVLITEDMLPSEMFDADGSYPALNGGGDIRFSSDSAGTTQLACEVVSFVTDNNPANGSAEIWVKVPTLSGSTDTTIYVWYNKSGESQPAVTDTYGRNAVWSDYIAVWHFEGTGTQTDSTGNSHSAAATDISDFAGKFGGSGGAIELNGSSSYLLVSDATALRIHESGDPDWIASGWVLPDLESTSNQQILNKFSEYAVWADSADAVSGDLEVATGTYGSNNLSTVTEAVSVGSWNKFDIKVDVGTSIQSHINGSANGGAHSTSDVSAGSAQDFYIGAYLFSGTGPITEYFDGKFDEFRLRNSNSANVTADWVATEYNNQNSPSTFASAGTPESVGGAISQAITSATETDAAQALTANKARALTLATETGEAQALGRAKRKLIEPALETDTAQPVSFLGQIIQAITPALEAETAVALGKAKAKAIGVATETDEAITLTFSGAKAIEPALETGEAIALGKAKRKAISPALETDEARPVSLTLAVALSAALETDTALALGKAKRKAIEPAVESDTAVAVTLFRETTLVQADIDAIADAVYTKLVSEGLVQKLLELWQLQGLDIANPMTVTPTTRQVDAISLALTGDGVTTTTVTRQ